MASHASNGCPRAVRKGYADIVGNFRGTPSYLATIDFGTTHCSVAYLRLTKRSNPSENDPMLLKFDNRYKRVPNCVLFDMNGKMIAFGYEAQERYSTIKSKLQYHYFEHVKKNLQHDKVK